MYDEEKKITNGGVDLDTVNKEIARLLFSVNELKKAVNFAEEIAHDKNAEEPKNEYMFLINKRGETVGKRALRLTNSEYRIISGFLKDVLSHPPNTFKYGILDSDPIVTRVDNTKFITDYFIDNKLSIGHYEIQDEGEER